MPTLTDAESVELVIPVPPMTVHRTIERRSDSDWAVQGWTASFTSAFAAMTEVRAEVERDARHPIRVLIRWRGVPAGFVPPTTGTAL